MPVKHLIFCLTRQLIYHQVDASLVRRIMEEPIELIGYIQILLASVESIFEFHRKQNPHRQMIAGADAITGR